MIVLAVADLHYDLRKFDWVTGMAELSDILIMAGDHLEISSTVARPAQAILVGKYFQKIRAITNLVVSSGNHDLDLNDTHGEMTARWMRAIRHHGIPTDGDSFFVGETLISVCPWIDGECQRHDQRARFATDAQKAKGPWIWVYHSPPEGSPTSMGRHRSWGDPWLNEWIDEFQPSIVFAGHVHEAPFSKGGCWVDRVGKTFVFNAGHQPGPFPSFIVLDTEKRKAFWHSQAGTEAVDLGEAGPGVDPMPITLMDLPASIGPALLRLES